MMWVEPAAAGLYPKGLQFSIFSPTATELRQLLPSGHREALNHYVASMHPRTLVFSKEHLPVLCECQWVY